MRRLLVSVSVAVLAVVLAAPASAEPPIAERTTPTLAAYHGDCYAGLNDEGYWGLECGGDKGGARLVYRFRDVETINGFGVQATGLAAHRIRTVIKGRRVVVMLRSYVAGSLSVLKIAVR